VALEVHSLASGSSGNAVLVKDDSTAILIDAGISIRRLTAALDSAHTNPSDLSAILITHEHTDHTSGAVRTANKYGVPLVANGRTLDAIPGASGVPTRVLDVGDGIAFGDLEVRSFMVSHDAACPVGYTIHGSGATVTSATDTGMLSPEIRAEAANADLLIIESNHDEEMLIRGPYPPHLKRRITGERGHLSNDAAAGLIIDLAESGKSLSVWLAHLSLVNNTPAIALATAQYLLWACSGAPMDISVALRDVPSLSWEQTTSRYQLSLFSGPFRSPRIPYPVSPE
jgi:phosphoribosyl 1,2-cyclic phosphodiesterase